MSTVVLFLPVLCPLGALVAVIRHWPTRKRAPQWARTRH